MKRPDLLRHLEKHGCRLLREGGSHSVYWNPVARHREVNDDLARKICRDLHHARLGHLGRYIGGQVEHFIGIDVSKATLDIASLPDGGPGRSRTMTLDSRSWRRDFSPSRKPDCPSWSSIPARCVTSPKRWVASPRRNCCAACRVSVPSRRSRSSHRWLSQSVARQDARVSEAEAKLAAHLSRRGATLIVGGRGVPAMEPATGLLRIHSMAELAAFAQGARRGSA